MCIPHIVVAALFPYFIGSDHGSALMTRNWVIGEDYTHFMPFHYRPPLLGLMILPFTYVFGDIGGGQFMVVLSVAIAGLGTFYLSRVWMDRHLSTICAIILMSLPVISFAPWVWYNSFLAIGLGLFVIRLIIQPARLSWVIAPILMMIIGGMNQTAFLATLLCLLAFPGLDRRRLALLSLSVLATAPWWPFIYKSIFLTSSSTFIVPPLSAFFLVLNAWGLLGIPAFVIIFYYLRYYSPVRRVLILTMALYFLMLIPGSMTTNFGSRMTWVTPFFAIIHIAYIYRNHEIISNIKARKKALVGIVCAFTVASVFLYSVISVWNLTGGGRYFLTPDIYQSTQWIDINTDIEDVVLYPPGELNMIFEWGLSNRMSFPFEKPIDGKTSWTPVSFYPDSQCVIGEIECSDDEPSHFDYVVWHEPLNTSQLVKVNENAAWHIYEVHRPEINRSPVLGRAWPWSPELKWE